MKKFLKENCNLQQVSDTRWECRFKAVKVFRYQLDKIHDALLHIVYEGADGEIDQFDTKSKFTAETLAVKINTFEFVVMTVLWYEVLFQINVPSKMMQNINENIIEVKAVIENIKTFFDNLKNEDKFENIIDIAQELANNIDAPTEFPNLSRIRQRRARQSLSQNDSNSSEICDPKLHFKNEVYNAMITAAQNSIFERFSKFEEHHNRFSFLTDIAKLKDKDTRSIQEKCESLEKALTDIKTGHKDIVSEELCDELQHLAQIIPADLKPIETLNFILKYDIAPNAAIAFRIMLTIPVSVASTERSFSKLKLIKNYLRSTMSQERLSGLAVLSIDHDILKNISVEDIIENFATVKARNVKI